MIKRVGFVGVGTMGEPMAANLLQAGFEVAVVAHRNRAPIERLLQKGATEKGSIAELAGEVEVLVSCVSNDAAVEEVMLGQRGVREGGHPGLIVVDTSTISPLTSRRVAATLAERDITMLDAPISGGQSGAIAGTLAIMVGGPRSAYERVLPVLQGMGKNITYIGENGSALVVKLCNNMIVAAITVAASEALTMAAKAGIDTGLVHQALSNATCRGWIINEKLANSVLVGNLKPGFKLELMRKDMGLALDFGKAMDVPMFLAALVHQLYTQADGLGKGELDTIGICELYTDATGVSLVKKS
ncbi:MAG: NAD(P)-dependent oxidoreductase [Chloroflexi bacterium]|nr:NAD(P)-dependent oxidoreductase [Chloroflexota bacterium]